MAAGGHRRIDLAANSSLLAGELNGLMLAILKRDPFRKG
jgi:hypothetical protein